MMARAGLKLVQRAAQVEASLWRRLRYEHARECREPLFERYTGFARALAMREYRRRPSYGLDIADFHQLAFSGLLEAIDRFDPLRGHSFESFAKARIRGAIADGSAKSSEAGAQFSHRRRLEQERLRSLRVESKAGVGEDVDYVSQLSDLAAALAIGFVAESTKTLAAARETPDPGLDAYESLAWREMQVAVMREIDSLPEKERTVLRQHYTADVAFTTIADLLGVTKGRVSQLHRTAINRVRERLRYLMR